MLGDSEISENKKTEFITKFPKFKGLIQVYTGSGKGKTTAALGQALRAVGRNMNVLIIQFMKKWDYGEIQSISLLPKLTLKTFGTQKFIVRGKAEKKDYEEAEEKKWNKPSEEPTVTLKGPDKGGAFEDVSQNNFICFYIEISRYNLILRKFWTFRSIIKQK